MPRGPVATTRQPDRAKQELVRTDRRWFLTMALVFALSIAVLFGALTVYHLTGPYPEVTIFIRRLRGLVRWLIPRHRHPPKWWW